MWKYVLQSQRSKDWVMTDLCDGDWLKEHKFWRGSLCIIDMILYVDDIEVVNQTGSRVKKSPKIKPVTNDSQMLSYWSGEVIASVERLRAEDAHLSLALKDRSPFEQSRGISLAKWLVRRLVGRRYFERIACKSHMVCQCISFGLFACVAELMVYVTNRPTRQVLFLACLKILNTRFLLQSLSWQKPH